jgi:hypothetical protein
MVLGVTGCSSVPSPYAEQIKAASQRYAKIGRDMLRPEIESKLGPATREDTDAAFVWETRYDKLNYAALKVWFDDHDRARKIQSVRAWGIETPGYSSEVSVARDK